MGSTTQPIGIYATIAVGLNAKSCAVGLWGKGARQPRLDRPETLASPEVYRSAGVPGAVRSACLWQARSEPPDTPCPRRRRAGLTTSQRMLCPGAPHGIPISEDFGADIPSGS